MAVLIPNKREFLARRLGDLGVVRLLERVARRPTILVVTYHRIGDPAAGPYYDGVYSASPEAFRAQVRALRERYHLVTLDEVVALAEGGFAVDRPTALITFDDGYRDNFDEALPILDDLGVPAAFFIATGFLRAPRLPWWDHAAYVLKRSGNDRVVLDWPEPMTVALAPGARDAAIGAVVGLYLAGKIQDEARFRAHLEERAGVPVDDDALGRALFMTWDQVRTLAGAGMAIGSHTREHRNLAALTEADARRELAGSRQVLEEEIGREVRALAYPFGWPGTYGRETERLAGEAGYRVAFTSSAGVNRPGASEALALRRAAVGFHDSPALFRARTALQTAFGTSFL